MKELILHATLAATQVKVTLPWVCTQLSLLIAGHETVDGELPSRLLCQPQEDALEVWLKDDAPCHDHRLCRYRRLVLRPLEILPVAVAQNTSPCKTRDVRIAVDLLPAACLYTDAPLPTLLEQDLQPRRVMASGQVLPMEQLTPVQMRRMHQIYAVMDSQLAAHLHCPLHTPQPRGHRPNRYAELESEISTLLSACFHRGGTVEGCPLHLKLETADVDACRLHSIGQEYRQLIFGENYTAEDPRTAFVEHGACVPSARRTLRLVMLYPKGALDTARSLCRLLQSFSGLIAVYPMAHEEGWIEYEVSNRVVEDIRESLRLRCLNNRIKQDKQPNGTKQELLVCYISPSGQDAVMANSLRLRAHVGLVCRFLNMLFMDSIPCRAIGGEALEQNAANLASSLVVKLRGLSWVPRQILTQDTDLVICLSQLHRNQDHLCGATFCFNQKAVHMHEFTCKEHLFLSHLYSNAGHSFADFLREHDNRQPRRIVIYCYRHVDVCHLEDFARLLSGALPDIPLVVAFLRLTGTGYPAFYEPSSPCSMPCDGTYVSCPDDTYLLFCNDFRLGDTRLPRRYPHPLEVRLKHLNADGSYSPVPPQEAVELMTQVYQLTNLNPERVDRCALPVLASHTDKLLRCTHDEKVAQDTASAAFALAYSEPIADANATNADDGAMARGTMAQANTSAKK